MEVQEVQRLFRGINTRIAEMRGEDATLSLICECGHVSCFRVLEVVAAEFDGVRHTPGALVVWREHVERPMALVSDHGETCIVHERDARLALS
jgi:hypothetical protein